MSNPTIFSENIPNSNVENLTSNLSNSINKSNKIFSTDLGSLSRDYNSPDYNEPDIQAPTKPELMDNKIEPLIITRSPSKSFTKSLTNRRMENVLPVNNDILKQSSRNVSLLKQNTIKQEERVSPPENLVQSNKFNRVLNDSAKMETLIQSDKKFDSVMYGKLNECSPTKCSPTKCSPTKCSPTKCSPTKCSPTKCSTPLPKFSTSASSLPPTKCSTTLPKCSTSSSSLPQSKCLTPLSECNNDGKISMCNMSQIDHFRCPIVIFIILTIVILLINWWLLYKIDNVNRYGQSYNSSKKWSAAVIGFATTLIIGVLFSSWLLYMCNARQNFTGGWAIFLMSIILPFIIGYLAGLFMGEYIGVGHLWFPENPPQNK
jgi:hypothetical protein